MPLHLNNRGFTLVELSIVLVILGLLVGGVLSGQSLIRAAELRSINTQYLSYKTAIHTFRDKYFALPGDMSNAVRYWGSASSGSMADGVETACANLTAASTDQKTCNGDANNQIGPSGTTYFEWYRFWQHLANAGLIEGTFSGVSGSGGTYTSVIGTNVPRSKIANGGWTVRYISFWNMNDNVFVLGATIANDYTYGQFIKAEEIYNIDMKMDDGLPATGVVRQAPYGSYAYNCVTSGNGAYQLSGTDSCPIYFMLKQ